MLCNWPNEIKGMNGCPTNRDWLVVWTAGDARISFDGGVTFPIIIPLPDVPATIFANLKEIYSVEVHPTV
jgi:hypothetical protein